MQDEKKKSVEKKLMVARCGELLEWLVRTKATFLTASLIELLRRNGVTPRVSVAR